MTADAAFGENTAEELDETHLAIVGMAFRFPGASDPETFWANLEAGVDSVRPFTDAELAAWSGGATRPADPRYVDRHGVVDGLGEFDAGFFGYTARDAALLNPQNQMFLECAWEVLERAGYDPMDTPGVVGVYAGAARNGYESVVRSRAEEFPGIDDFAISLGNEPEQLCPRVAYTLGLTGPAVTVLSACSTSLVAVHEAGRALLAGDCDLALAGAASVRVPREGYWYRENGVMSPEGRCRAFDADAKGIVAGDGVAVVALRLLADAVADGDPVLAVVRGTAVNNDGRRRAGFTAPSIAGQAEVVRAAHAAAGLGAADISYVEAHGTGTPVGDPIEVTALAQAFGDAGLPPGSVGLGSVKANIGHTDTAAGAAGLVKTVLALQHRRIPPTPGFHTPNPAIDFGATPFVVTATGRPWVSPDGVPRCAGVSSFGMGGSNAHLVVQEAPPGPATPPAPRGSELLVLSARTPEALGALAEDTCAHLRRHPGGRLDETAWTLQAGRHAFPHRGYAVVTPGAEPRFTPSPAPAGAPSVTFLLPGQGSLRPGVTTALRAAAPEFRTAVDECADLLAPLLGRDLRTLLHPAPEHTAAAGAELERIEYAQPALFVLDYAMARMWQAWGVVPDAMLGHSLGDLVAACLAGVLTLPDAMTVVAGRAAALATGPAGEMLAVSLPPERIAELLTADGVAVAAVNGPQQCVVAGTAERVADLRERVHAAGAHSRPVPAGHPFHTPAMAPAAAAFGRVLDRVTLRPPSTPFVSTVSGTWITADEATDPGFWTGQLVRPVLFEQAFTTLLSTTGDGVLLEAGPGQTLSSLATLRPRETRRRALPSLGDVTKAGEEVSALLATVGALWQAGTPIDWARLHGADRPRRVALPTYPFQRAAHVVLPRRGAGAPSAAPPDAPVTRPAQEPAGTAETMRELFGKVLRCDEDLDDPHFFEQGGDSLAAMQLTSLVFDEFAVTLPVEAVFEEPLASGLAAVVEKHLSASAA